MKPNNLFNQFSSLAEEPKKEDADYSEEEKALAYISHLKGWKYLEEYAQRLCEELDNLVVNSIENGANAKEVGERAIAKEIAKVYVKRLVGKISDARRAVDGE